MLPLSKNHSYTVLYCYPKDDTPGCTIEAQEFSHLLSEFAQHDVGVIGISPQSNDSHVKFIEKYNLGVELFADENKAVLRQLGAWGEKKNYGKTYEGVIRSTFLIKNDTQAIVKEWKNVKAAGHAQKVLDFIKTL